MAEFSNSNTVSVAAGENLPLTETAVKAPACSRPPRGGRG